MSIEQQESAFRAGTGSPDDPFQVSSVQEFNRIADFPNKHFIQTQDLDFSLLTEPLRMIYDFTGTYDGQCHFLSNVTLKADFGPAPNILAIFNSNRDPVPTCKPRTTFIRNLTVANINFILENQTISECYLGGLVGNLQSGRVENVTVGTFLIDRGNFEGEIDVGGVIADMFCSDAVFARFLGPLTITTGSIRYVGGIAQIANTSNLYGCQNMANITGEFFAGGMVDECYQSNFRACENYGNISTSANEPGPFGNVASGLVSFGEGFVKVQSCVNYGAVNGYSAAGLVSCVDQTTQANLSDCLVANSVNWTSTGGRCVAIPCKPEQTCVPNVSATRCFYNSDVTYGSDPQDDAIANITGSANLKDGSTIFDTNNQDWHYESGEFPQLVSIPWPKTEGGEYESWRMRLEVCPLAKSCGSTTFLPVGDKIGFTEKTETTEITPSLSPYGFNVVWGSESNPVKLDVTVLMFGSLAEDEASVKVPQLVFSLIRLVPGSGPLVLAPVAPVVVGADGMGSFVVPDLPVDSIGFSWTWVASGANPDLSVLLEPDNTFVVSGMMSASETIRLTINSRCGNFELSVFLFQGCGACSGTASVADGCPCKVKRRVKRKVKRKVKSQPASGSDASWWSALLCGC